MNIIRFRSTLLAASVAAVLGVGLSACESEAEYPTADNRSDSMGDARSDSMGTAASDTALTTQVKAKLASDGNVGSSDISVETSNGVVTLTGSVADADSKSSAESSARSIDGVKTVYNNLTTSGTGDTWSTGGTSATGNTPATGSMSGTGSSSATGSMSGTGSAAGTGNTLGTSKMAGTANTSGTGNMAASSNTSGTGNMGATGNTSATGMAASRNTSGSTTGNTEQAASDAWITTKVKSELLADDISSSFDVSVETTDGVVALEGVLEDQAAIDHVQKVARGVERVASVDVSGLTIER